MNGPSSNPQMPSSTEVTTDDPVIDVESSDAVTQLHHHERTTVGRRRDHPSSTGDPRDHPPSTGDPRDHPPTEDPMDHPSSTGDPMDHPSSTEDPRDHLPSTGHRYHPRHPPPPPSYPVELAPSPLIRSASAPPDYVPSPAASRQHRATRSHWTTSPEDDFRLFQMPPEVVETRRRPKECSACCLRCIVVMTTLRWLFVMAALLGAGCVVTGIVFGVMSSTLNKNAFFVLAFTFIGLGIVLVLVVGIGWRCSPAGHEPCHALCHLAAETPSGGGGTTAYDTGTQRGATRLMHRSRNQWYAGFLYPEFHYATPPPSYSISMQQYRQQVVQQQCAAAAVDRDRSILGNSSITSLDNLSSLPSSPPPTYRSRIVGRVRPPLSAVMTFASGASSSAELPPPYQNSSTASSLDRLADVEEQEATGSLDPVLATLDLPEDSTDNEQRLDSSDPSDLPMEEEGGIVVVLEPVATPSSTHVINLEPMAIIASTPSVPSDKQEVQPSVRNIVHRFENFVNVPRTGVDVSERTNRSPSGPCTESTDQEPGFPADQSRSRKSKNDDELCSVSQSLKASSRNNQSNVRISGEASCSSTQSPNVHSSNNQSHLRLSSLDADSRSINLLPGTSTTANQISKARSTTTTKRLDMVRHLQPTSFNNVTNDVHATNQSSSDASQQDCGSGQSPDDRPIQILPAANRFHSSSNSNQSYRDFGRSQSLNGPEIGESGI